MPMLTVPKKIWDEMSGIGKQRLIETGYKIELVRVE